MAVQPKLAPCRHAFDSPACLEQYMQEDSNAIFVQTICGQSNQVIYHGNNQRWAAAPVWVATVFMRIGCGALEPWQIANSEELPNIVMCTGLPGRSASTQKDDGIVNKLHRHCRLQCLKWSERHNLTETAMRSTEGHHLKMWISAQHVHTVQKPWM
jgi:hypothetical protein